MKTFLWMFVFFLAILFAIHFSLQNTGEVTLRYALFDYSWESPPIPIFLTVFLCLFLGAFLGGLGDFYRRFRLKRALRQSQKTIERLEKEVQAFKGLEPNLSSYGE